MENTQTLAQRCFDLSSAGDELFDAVNKILGADVEKCLDPDFKFQAEDTYWDFYDNSVEVIRSHGASFMIREQANQILDLGFGQIYESVGDEGKHWSRSSEGKCSPRKGDEKQRLRAEISALRAKLEK